MDLVSAHQEEEVDEELLDESISEWLFPVLAAEKSEDDDVSEEGPVQEELPWKFFEDVFLEETISFALYQELSLRISLCEVQGKHKSKVGTNTDNRVIGEDKLRLRIDLFLWNGEWVPRTDYIFFGDVDIDLLRVDNVCAFLDLF